jgi:hypothetical protein
MTNYYKYYNIAVLFLWFGPFCEAVQNQNMYQTTKNEKPMGTKAGQNYGSGNPTETMGKLRAKDISVR